jgi:NhaA family Na+:H+ antiporter
MKRIRKTSLEQFIQHESSAGILLFCSSLLALLLANSPAYGLYELLIDTPLAIQIGTFILSKPLLLWVNDGMMAVFFMLIGLELKRKYLEGELSNTKKVLLPAFGAFGGLIVPVMIYIFFNINDPVAIKGWGIPAATDIAFVLAVVSLLGSRVPASLKEFLTSLAIFDDIALIIIIAFFYTSKISLIAMCIALACLIVLSFFNWCGISETSVYVVIGIIMWVAVLKSGVHATLAGFLFAMFIPMKSTKDRRISPLKAMEHDLHAVVAFVILPVFTFCNFGINFHGLPIAHFFHNIPLGIALGLFLGKQVGVFLFCWLGIKLKLAVPPKGLTWPVLYGAAVLTGIGFSISLFKGSLAFEETGVNLMYDERLGILLGSIASGILGFCILYKVLGNRVGEIHQEQ